MNASQRRLSVFFAAFVAFKVVEATLRIEAWPVSSVSMFAGYRPRQVVPLLPRLLVTRNGESVELTHHDFLLTRGEFLARLHPDAGVAARCGRLVASWNATAAAGAAPIEQAVVVVEPIARPGIWNDFVPRKVTCPIAAAGAGRVGTAR